MYMSNATRISDLPDNMGQSSNFPPQQQQHSHSHSQQQQQQQQQQQMMGGMSGDANTYMPMNVHPNPYSNGADPVGPPPPIHDFREPRNGNSGGHDRGGGGGYDLGMSMSGPGSMQEQYIPQQQQRLPSRDIPMDTTLYAQDEDIQVNRLPKPPKSVRIRDYVDEYIESDAVDRIERHENDKRRQSAAEHVWMDIQIPILVALLYMVFQMEVVHRILYRYAQGLGIYSSDGTLNMYGIMFKGSLFGSIYAMLMKVIQLVL